MEPHSEDGYQRAAELLEQLESIWDCAEAGRVQAFRQHCEQVDETSLVEVLRHHQQRRWLSGTPVKVEDYLTRFPCLADNPALVLALIFGEVQLRKTFGQSAEVDEYVARFPQHQSAVRRQFQLHELIASGSTSGNRDGWTSDGSVQRPTQPLVSLDWKPDGYRLLQLLGRGGMGVVYLARQVNLNRTVAVKILPGGCFADQKAVQRFRREAEAAANLHHPNIVAVHDVGEHDGHHFYSMDYIEGQTLQQLAAGRPMEPREAARCVANIARAIHYAHQQGIVHRDLKPANVLIDQRGQPRITDFGLSKQINKGGSLTRDGALVGTPGYMSPEQAAGETDRVGPLSDVYGLGAILYFLLVGRPPFAAGSRSERIRRSREEDPLPPRGAGAAAVPRDLEVICLKALARQPQDRYRSAEQMAEDLERFLRDEPIVARAASPLQRAAKWCKRNREVAVSTALVIVVLIAGAVISGLLAMEARRRAREAEQNARLFAGAKRQAEQKAREAQAHARRAAQLAEAEARTTLQARRVLYANQMTMAQQALETGQIERAWRLLNNQWPEPGQQDLRGFDWYCLWHMLRSELAAFSGHEGRITSLAWSPDGKLLASAGFDGTVRLWNAASGRGVGTLRGHREVVIEVAFSPDGRLLASASGDRTVGIWDIGARQRVRWLKGHEAPVNCIAFAPDGRHLATGDDLGVVHLWQVDVEAPMATLEGHSDIVRGVAFSPDGKWLATCGRDNLIKIWDWANAAETTSLAGHTDLVDDVVFSPDGRWLASASWDGSIALWNTGDWSRQRVLKGHTNMVRNLAFTPDGSQLVSGSGDQTVRLWDVATGNTVRVFEGHQGLVWDVAISPDGATLASCAEQPRVAGDPSAHGNSSRIKLWDVRTGSEQRPKVRWDQRAAIRQALPSWVWDLAFSPDGATVAVACEDVVVRLYEAADLQPTATLAGHTQRVRRISWCDDGKLLASGSDDQTVRIWDPRTFQMQAVIHPGTGTWGLRFVPHSTQLLWGAGETAVQMFDPTSGEQRGKWYPAGATVRSLAVSSDASLLAIGAESGTIWLWDIVGNKQLHRMDGHQQPATELTFTPDGTTLASGSEDRTARLWDVASGSCRAVLRGHLDQIHDVAVSPDGKRLATASKDKTVKLWDVATGAELLTLRGHADFVGAVDFSPDGRTLAAGIHGWSGRPYGELVLWRTADPRELFDDCRRRAAEAPGDVQRQLDLIRCCWNLAADPAAQAAGLDRQELLQLGRRVLTQLDAGAQSSDLRRRWLQHFAFKQN